VNYVYDAGVYLIRSRKTGASYIGASCDVTTRMATHRGQIRHGKCVTKTVGMGFANHRDEDIEFVILERVRFPRDPKDSRIYMNAKNRQGWDKLMARERHWIRELQPSLNQIHKSGMERQHIPAIDDAPAMWLASA
jgi:predicted GIY-YIG superfamily endonuclease